jgi:hypothetical protein
VWTSGYEVRTGVLWDKWEIVGVWECRDLGVWKILGLGQAGEIVRYAIKSLSRQGECI